MESGSTKMAPSWEPVAPLVSSTDRPLPPLHDGADFLHHTVTCESAALALAVDTQRARMLVGMQSGEICAWDLDTFQPCARLIGHRSSVLSLILVDDYLFSASSDSTVRIWDAATLMPLALVFPASTNTGDIFCLAWDHEKHVLYFGCQDTSIQWLPVTRARLHEPTEPLPTLSSFDKFFDSRPRTHRQAAPTSSATAATATTAAATATQTVRSATATALVQRTSVEWLGGSADGSSGSKGGESAGHNNSSSAGDHVDTANDTAVNEPVSAVRMAVLSVDAAHVMPSAHNSYVYCLSFAHVNGETMLASGAGDEAVRLWRLHPHTASPMLFRTLVLPHPSGDAVLSLAAWKGTLLAGKQGGAIDVWDMESYTPIRVLRAHTKDVLCLQVLAEGNAYVFWTGGADGLVCRFDRYFRCCGRLAAHANAVQSLALDPGRSKSSYSWLSSTPLLLTGASDARVRLWHYQSGATSIPPSMGSTLPGNTLLEHLSQFVRYKSVSRGPTMHAVDENFEDSRQAAHFLRSTLMELGASDVQLLPSGPGTNPIVLGTFHAPHPRKRCLFYGHYDCVPAGDGWDSDPWDLCGRDGYLYGRGVSDNKGPILAVAYAASELLYERKLDIDVVMLIEGEQESGSKPLQACLQKYKPLLGPIDTILVCNSYWLGERQPCLTIGLRGVIQAIIRISGLRADQHSGVDGGAEREPMMDMIKLLASLLDDQGRVTLPHFYDDVRAITSDDRAHLTALAQEASRITHAERLIALWRMPSLTVHQVTNSSTAHSTVIPKAVEASVSLRIVPDQNLQAIQTQFHRTIHSHFQHMHTPNRVDVEVFHCADWWLGSTVGPAWDALVAAVEAEWGSQVRIIREGGSIPGMALLEKELNAKALHLPMGQASDHAHLPNERIRLVNLEKGQAVVRRFFVALGTV